MLDTRSRAQLSDVSNSIATKRVKQKQKQAKSQILNDVPHRNFFWQYCTEKKPSWKEIKELFSSPFLPLLSLRLLLFKNVSNGGLAVSTVISSVAFLLFLLPCNLISCFSWCSLSPRGIRPPPFPLPPPLCPFHRLGARD